MAAIGVFSELKLLLSPKARSVVNDFRSKSRRQRIRAAGLISLGGAFWTGIFFATWRVLTHVQAEIPDFWQLLHYKLLSMVFLTFFSILLFSNVVTSLSAYFLSDDLDLVLAMPARIGAVYLSKFVETVVLSSWMVLIFGLPVIIGFGVVWRAGWRYYAWAAALEGPFLFIPAALGIMLTMTLVKIFPARRARDLLMILSLIMVGAVFVLFRLMRPEQFVNAADRVTLWQGVLSFEANDFSPSEWFTRILMELLHGRPAPALMVALLALTAFSLIIIGGWLAESIYREGWSKAQEGRRARLSRSGPASVIIEALASPFPKSMRSMVVKDIKTFFRDTTQWSQLFLLAAIMVVYVFNFRFLPLTRLPVNQFKLVNYVSFVNLALASFVTSAVAVRFVFPAVSLEGNAYWLVRVSPLRPKPYLWSKFLTSVTPLLVLSEALLIITNYLLKVSPFMMWLSVASIFVMTFGITGMGVGMGALYPRFHVENAAQISVSYGGVVYMVLAMSFISAAVVLLVTPTSAIFMAQLKGEPLGSFLWGALIVAFAVVTALSALSLFLPMRMGIRNLEAMEI